jgi:hypothetical protein
MPSCQCVPYFSRPQRERTANAAILTLLITQRCLAIQRREAAQKYSQ